MKDHITLLTGLVVWLTLAPGQTRAAPEIVARDVTLLAGQSFQMPLSVADPAEGPITFAVVSISDTNITGTFTTGNRSLRLTVTGQDAEDAEFAGDLIFELFDDLTPLTSARISELVEAGFYDGLTFHRIIDDFVAQGGDPNGDGTGGTGEKFRDEYDLQLSFTGFGQLAMANSGDDSNDSQFFITDVDLKLAEEGPEPPRHLTFNHSIFGQLTMGFDVMESLMGTPVAGSAPLEPVTIVSAALFTNEMATVLRLFAPANFTGSATVTVSATTTNAVTTATTFTVTVIPNDRNERPFLAPLPDLVTTQNVQVAVVLVATDLEGDDLNLFVLDAVTLGNLQNADVTFDVETRELRFTPWANFTGVIEILVGVRDQTNRGGGFISEHDTERITLTVLPGGDDAAIAVTLRKGKLFNAITRFEDRVDAQASFVFGEGVVEPTFDPSTELFEFFIGDSINGVRLPIFPGEPGWKVRKSKYRWRTDKESFVKIKLQFDLAKGKFKFSLRQFNFSGAQRNPMQFQLTIGQYNGADPQEWPQRHVGVHRFPN